MMKRGKSLGEQVIEHSKSKPEKVSEYKGDERRVISTGSTLLDLAISGGRIRGGGIPTGILVEISGPASTGKTVLLCMIAGNVLKNGGQVKFIDPEYRLDTQFARIFGMHVEDIDYTICDTVPELFTPIRSWSPEPNNIVHGIFADSLAALSTKMELEDKDKTGMRRAKEFSEECRKTCRTLVKKGFLMVCSNQIRQNVGAGEYAPKYVTSGGEAIGFYSSLRLRTVSTKDIKITRRIRKADIMRIIGVETTIRVIKSSVWKPKHEAAVHLIYDTGVDDIRANLKFIKEICGYKEYKLGDEILGKNVFDAKAKVKEDPKLIMKLREETIDLWEEIESKFKQT